MKFYYCLATRTVWTVRVKNTYYGTTVEPIRIFDSGLGLTAACREYGVLTVTQNIERYL